MSLSDDVRFSKLSKKEQEREILDGFLERLGYKAKVLDSERPDFNIDVQNQLVGVEVTKFFGDASRHGSVVEQRVSKWTKSLDTHIFSKPRSDWPTPPFQSGYVEPASIPISAIIRTKETKAASYERTFDQTWLIIYAAGFGYHDLCLSVPEQSIQSDYFSHMFLWDKFTESIFLLFPYHKKIFDFGSREIFINHLPIANA